MEPVDDKGKGEASDGAPPAGDLDAVQQMLRNLASGCVLWVARQRAARRPRTLAVAQRAFCFVFSAKSSCATFLPRDSPLMVGGTEPAALEAVEAWTRRTLGLFVVAHSARDRHRLSA